MPLYNFRNKETNEYVEHLMPYSKIEEFLENNPDLEHTVSAPNISYNDAKKPDDNFRDILRDIKKNSPRSDINTF